MKLKKATSAAPSCFIKKATSIVKQNMQRKRKIRKGTWWLGTLLKFQKISIKPTSFVDAA